MVSVVSVPEASNPVSERSIDSFARDNFLVIDSGAKIDR